MTLKAIAFLAGLFVLIVPMFLPAPDGMSGVAWMACALAATMAFWWMTEALPLAATALLPLAIGPIYGVAPIGDLARFYSDPLIILFLGGFLIAKSIETSNLHRRIAGFALRFAGTNARGILWAVMLCTAFLSLWISNTASAMVVTPIALAIAASQDDHPTFGTALMLGVAFAATIGGMGSLIGTPPNALFAAFVKSTYGVQISFAQWAAIGIPLSFVLLVCTWLVLVKVSPSLAIGSLNVSFSADTSPMNKAERRVAIIAGLTALGWLTRPFIDDLFPGIELTDTGIAMIAALALFAIPDGAGNRLLDWESARNIRWDVLILFGGGLALAGIIQETGLAAWIGGGVELVAHLPELLLILMFGAVIVYVGELASNTAMAAIFLPIAGAVATTLNSDPITFILPVAFAASIGFMLPVATPPNAIVLSTPQVNGKDMLRAGAPLDAIALVITVGFCSLLAPLIFG